MKRCSRRDPKGGPLSLLRSGRGAECFVGPRGPVGSRGFTRSPEHDPPRGRRGRHGASPPLSISCQPAPRLQRTCVTRWATIKAPGCSGPPPPGAAGGARSLGTKRLHRPSRVRGRFRTSVAWRSAWPTPAGPCASIRTGGHPPPSPRGSPTRASYFCRTGPMRAGTAFRLALCGCPASGRGRRAPRCA